MIKIIIVIIEIEAICESDPPHSILPNHELIAPCLLLLFGSTRKPRNFRINKKTQNFFRSTRNLRKLRMFGVWGQPIPGGGQWVLLSSLNIQETAL